MPKRNDKPDKEAIMEQFQLCKEKYGALQTEYEEDEAFYELNFKDKLNVPNQFKKDIVILPTARDVVDTGVNHTNIFNARVKTVPKSDKKVDVDAASMLRKLGRGVIHGINVESRIAPSHLGAKHYWLHGLAVFKTIWDVDRWVDKPEQKDGESESDYAGRLDEWRSGQHLSLPIAIQAVNPYHIMPDPYTGGDYYVIEWHKRKLYDVKRIWPKFKPKREIDPSEEVETFSYWTDRYRAEFVDDEMVLGVIEHGYGFNPYTLIESGLGYVDKDNTPENRYVGLIRKIKDLLVSESTNYTLNDILMKKETMKGGWIENPNRVAIPDWSFKYGEYEQMPEGVVIHEWENKVTPESSWRQLATTHDYISAHAAPRSARGLAEQGVRSGADRRLITAEASAIYEYAAPAFQNGWAQILTKCAMLVKNKIPGDFEVWSRTPEDEFDVMIKKEKLREPFNISVEFAPISEEDEYRRHEDDYRALEIGLGNKRWARDRRGDMDADSMEKRDMVEAVLYNPVFLQMVMQHVLPAIHQALANEGMPAMIDPNNPMATMGQAPGQPGASVQGRGQPNTPAQPMSPMGSMGQGNGGGGNTLYGT